MHPVLVSLLYAFLNLGAVALPVTADGGELPRVVSINLCTDQLAMMVAAPGQILSLSHLAVDPRASSMAKEATAYPLNRGGAEQVFLSHPDLVLASIHTSQATVDLLRKLGMNVVQVPDVSAFDQIPESIRRVAGPMGRAKQGEALIARFERDLAALTSDLPPRRAALYYPNGYSVGTGTLSNEVLSHAGFRNLAAEIGLSGGGNLPLENLVMAAPALVITSPPYPGASRAEEILSHPALAELQRDTRILDQNDADWLCGTPHVLRALARIKAAREAME